MAGLSMIALLVLFCSVAGIIVLTLGLRGRPVFTSPRCSGCAYDLRAMNFMAGDTLLCPECGAKLSEPGRVNFGRLVRNRRMIVGGVVILVLPWVGVYSLQYMTRRNRIVAVSATRAPVPTSRLLANLSNTITQPDSWRELERRLQAGSLSQAEIDAAFTALTAHLTSVNSRNPPPWAQNFVDTAIRNKSVGAAPLGALLKSMASPGPSVVLRSAHRVNQPLRMSFRADDSRMHQFKTLWFLRGITTRDGKELALLRTDRNRDRYPSDGEAHFPDQLSWIVFSGSTPFSVTHGLEPGEHELTFVFDIGVVPNDATLRGLDGRAGTPDKWPAPLAKWEHTTTKKFRVVPPDQPVVQLVTDEARQPLNGMTITVDQLIARPATDGVELLVKWGITGPSALTVNYRAAMELGGVTIRLGTLSLEPASGRSTYSTSYTTRVQSLPPDVRTVDITLTPDPTDAERLPGVDEIWGQPHTIKGVTLERYDISEK